MLRNRGWGAYAVFCWVRRQRVQICTRFIWPFTASFMGRTLGRHIRGVRRLEWLTLCPNWTPLPHT
jgi:hypothetical protein